MTRTRHIDPNLRLEALRLAVQSSRPDAPLSELEAKAENFVDFVTAGFTDDTTETMTIDITPVMKAKLIIDSASGIDQPSRPDKPLSTNAQRYIDAAARHCDKHNGVISTKTIRERSGLPAGSMTAAMDALKKSGHIRTIGMGGPVNKIQVLKLPDGTPFTGGTYQKDGITICPTVTASGSHYSEEFGRHL